jgi:8-oxo-dGTP pyrophosphatase MutT (NUDIX family)
MENRRGALERKTAAGFILARIVKGEPRYLLLLSTNSGKWLPPKGHTDDDEAPLTTALRETVEETGITEVTPVAGFERSIEYEVNTRKRGNYVKRVTYLLATTTQSAVERSEEHKDAGWFSLDEALARIEFEQTREVVRAGHAALRASL